MVHGCRLYIVELANPKQPFAYFLKQSITDKLVVAMFFGNNLLANGCRLEFELADERVVQDRLPFLYEYQLPDANESLVRSCTNRQ